MDWAMIRKSMDDAMQACIENDGVMDEAAKQLVAFVPADPNETADWLWLKQRGWECFLETWSLPGTELNWHRGYLRCGHAQLDLDPTRMTVALFEAAAMEAMKHG